MPTVNELNLKVNVTYGDSSLSDQHSPETNLVIFILWGIVLPLIAAMGLVGNILTILVLWRKEMHSTTILYLRGMAITDTGILIGSVITLTPISCANYMHSETLVYFKDMVYPLIHTPGYYIIMTLQQCNVWITVSVSMERYIAICHPFRAARIITRGKTLIVLISTVICSLIYNIPHLLATRAEPCSVQHSAESQVSVVMEAGSPYEVLMSSTPAPSATVATQTTVMSDCLQVSGTVFGMTDFYIIYRTFMYSIIIYVIPFLALVILNSFLIKELMTMQRRRSGTNIHEENEANLSLVLVLIVIVFIFCQTPGLISQFDIVPIDSFYYWLGVSNLLFTTNSAVNFLIYTAFGRKFRRVLLRVFRHLFSQSGRRSQTTTHSTVTELSHSSPVCSVACYTQNRKHNSTKTELVPLNSQVTVANASVQNGNTTSCPALLPVPCPNNHISTATESIPLTSHPQDKTDQL